MKLPPLKKSLDQAFKAVYYVRRAPDFIINNKLWKSYFDNGWGLFLPILIGVVISLKFFSEIKDLFINTVEGETASQSLMTIMSGLGNLGDKVLFSGNTKFLVLLFLEMLIYHAVVKTYEILSGENIELKLKDFIDAQFRMLKVIIRSWFYENIISFLVMLILGLFGLGVLGSGADFIIQCFFIGVVFIDNYNEQFEITVKESFSVAYDHFGATLVFGFVAYLLMYLPLVGAILASLVGAVAATCYLYKTTNKEVVELSESIILDPSI